MLPPILLERKVMLSVPAVIAYHHAQKELANLGTVEDARPGLLRLRGRIGNPPERATEVSIQVQATGGARCTMIVHAGNHSGTRTMENVDAEIDLLLGPLKAAQAKPASGA